MGLPDAYGNDFDDDGASFRVRRQRFLDRRDTPRFGPVERFALIVGGLGAAGFVLWWLVVIGISIFALATQ